MAGSAGGHSVDPSTTRHAAGQDAISRDGTLDLSWKDGTRRDVVDVMKRLLIRRLQVRVLGATALFGGRTRTATEAAEGR